MSQVACAECNNRLAIEGGTVCLHCFAIRMRENAQKSHEQWLADMWDEMLREPVNGRDAK